MKLSLLQRLIDRRDKLSAAIEVLREELGDELGTRAYRRASKALEISGNGSPGIAGIMARQAAIKKPAKARKQYRSSWAKNSVFRGTNREVKQIAVPSGVSFEGINIPEAIALAVRAVDEPIPTPELRLLLETAGVKFPKTRMPRNRLVGMSAASLARTGEIKRTPEGWATAKGKR